PPLRLDRVLPGARVSARPAALRVRPVPRGAVRGLRRRGPRREAQPRPLLRRRPGWHAPLPAARLLGPQPPVHRGPGGGMALPLPPPRRPGRPGHRGRRAVLTEGRPRPRRPRRPAPGRRRRVVPPRRRLRLVDLASRLPPPSPSPAP